jgi:hypothetical protein
MKKKYTLMKAFSMLVLVALLSSGNLFAQNTTITDNSSHTASTAAVLDVYSTTLGMLVPRLSSDPSSTAQGLLYYNTGSNFFRFHDGSNWNNIPIQSEILWSSGGGTIAPKTVTDKVAIGHGAASTWLHIFEGTGSNTPQVELENNQTNGYSGISFTNTSGGPSSAYSAGLIGSDQTFIIRNTAGMSTGSQSDGFTMMKAYNSGIVDFDNQSRARAYLNTSQSIPSGTWTMIQFDQTNYDEQSEFNTSVYYFTATEEGYYQVNSRTEFYLGDENDTYWVLQDSYVSIAIYKGTTAQPPVFSMYAQGNNLQIGQIASGSPPTPENAPSFKYNNAPNVSDVVYLNVGERIAIYAWQNAGFGLNLITGTAKTYVSIHKVS